MYVLVWRLSVVCACVIDDLLLKYTVLNGALDLVVFGMCIVVDMHVLSCCPLLFCMK
jgi:hypothetical protein